jgi:hypothetical protein
VRLFSTKSLKPLGTLVYHKVAVQTLTFARAWPPVAPHHHRGDLPTGGTSGARIGLSAAAADQSGSGDSDTVAGGDDADADDTDVNLVDADEGEGEGEYIADGDGARGGDDDDDGDEEEDADTDTDEMSAEEKARRSRWLVSGGKDGRVAVWALMDFTREGR